MGVVDAEEVLVGLLTCTDGAAGGGEKAPSWAGIVNLSVETKIIDEL